ncbi:hypothetical protein [Archaeoglobus sp.]
MILGLRQETIRIEQKAVRLINAGAPFYIYSDRQTSRNPLPPLKGIHIYGPYDNQTSSEPLKRAFKGIEIIGLCPEGEKRVENSLVGLLELLEGGYTGGVAFGDLKTEFRLERVYIPTSSDEIIKYKVGRLEEELREIKALYEEALRRGNIPVAVVGGTAHKSFSKRREQYLEAKRLLLREEVPVQYASYYEVESGGYGILYQIDQKRDVSYSLWNFSLNIYTKAGGLPWIVRQRNEQPLDLSIGIRFSRMPNRYAVGHAVVLDSFGRLVGTITLSKFYTVGMKIPRKEMKAFVSKVLEVSLKDPKIAKIYESGKDTLNVVFYRPNLFHPEEILGVKDALEDVKSSVVDVDEVKVGFIGVIQEPTFFLLDEEKEQKNVRVGTCVAINENTAIVSTTGSFQEGGQEREKSMSYPIIVCCQNLGKEDSPFTDLKEVCKHVIDLAGLHWQTIFPGLVRLPSALEFAQDVAQMYAKGISPPENSWLQRTLWFI